MTFIRKLQKDNPFRNSNNKYFTKALFKEESIYPEFVMYTLSTQDHPDGYPSIHKLYVEMEDPSEYYFANEYFESWDHWKVISNCEWFKPYLNAMREELEVRLKAQAIKQVKDIANDKTNKSSLQAAKFLFDKGYITDEEQSKKRGRPSKDEVVRKTKELAKEERRVQEDFERVQRTSSTRSKPRDDQYTLN